MSQLLGPAEFGTVIPRDDGSTEEKLRSGGG
jgi:hypothetical protein